MAECDTFACSSIHQARQEVMHKANRVTLHCVLLSGACSMSDSADAQEAITKEPEVGWAHAVRFACSQG